MRLGFGEILVILALALVGCQTTVPTMPSSSLGIASPIQRSIPQQMTQRTKPAPRPRLARSNAQTVIGVGF